jgi:hypothetical protein
MYNSKRNLSSPSTIEHHAPPSPHHLPTDRATSADLPSNLHPSDKKNENPFSTPVGRRNRAASEAPRSLSQETSMDRRSQMYDPFVQKISNPRHSLPSIATIEEDDDDIEKSIDPGLDEAIATFPEETLKGTSIMQSAC